MISKERVKELLQLNLRDERITSAALFISNIVQRKTYGSGVEQYRIKNTLTGQWVTSLDEFINSISQDDVFLSYPYEGERLAGDKVTGFLATIDHFEVIWNPESKSDKDFASFFDLKTQKLFQFLMVYMNDGDTTLPVKATYVKLVGS